MLQQLFPRTCCGMAGCLMKAGHALTSPGSWKFRATRCNATRLGCRALTTAGVKDPTSLSQSALTPGCSETRDLNKPRVERADAAQHSTGSNLFIITFLCGLGDTIHMSINILFHKSWQARDQGSMVAAKYSLERPKPNVLRVNPGCTLL